MAVESSSPGQEAAETKHSLDLIIGTHQVNMFEDPRELIRLYQAIDRRKN